MRDGCCHNIEPFLRHNNSYAEINNYNFVKTILMKI